MRLFDTEVTNGSKARQDRGAGVIGFELDTVSRIAFMRKTWKALAAAISDLELARPYPQFPRQSSAEKIRSPNWVFTSG